MKIIVTGGAGFIGSNIVDSLVEIGHDVFIFDDFSTGKKENVNKKAKCFNLDINSLEVQSLLVKLQPDVLIHHAAQVSVAHSIKDPLYDQNLNIRGTVNLLEGCSRAGVGKFIYASSAAVYGDPIHLPINESHSKEPTSFYGLSKYVPETYIKLYSDISDLDYSILRYANVYGPRQDPLGEGGVISIFMNKIINDETLTIHGDGNQTRDFIFVKDIVSANLAALHNGSKKIMNISTNDKVTLNRLVEIMSEFTERPLKVNYGEKRKGDIKDSWLDNSLAKKELLWKPMYSLEEGLKLTFDYYMQTEEIVNTRGIFR
ncbi:NAD-dependent epimerase/dehydratase family protein [Paenibacillus sp. Y412MC10]|uniref:NAD-dependent epimerase/dehydratase family protein n=1 Tax=Geobacillus sp. (strain Y412MC10) TaxID=481743 RepID=UPI0011A1DC65|nr:NAD-dependent epimerase/dehydratase family protein [Paenibacillus sp. Y412MC10]